MPSHATNLFLYARKHQKTSGFFIFPRGVEKDQWHKMGKFFKRQPHKMVKHNQAICREQPTNCLSVFDHFVRLVLKGFWY